MMHRLATIHTSQPVRRNTATYEEGIEAYLSENNNNYINTGDNNRKIKFFIPMLTAYIINQMNYNS